ncbi:MAG: hypothetical protein K8R41_07725 [Bacteroidales bacterium]|nr:hypothetical protein [Bacteroidales bacterium]
MKNLKPIISILLIVFISISGITYSQNYENTSKDVKIRSEFKPGWAISAKVTTLGPGLEIVKSFSRKFNVRVGGTYLDFSVSRTFEAIKIKGTATFDMESYSLLGDFFITKNFHLTGGLIYNLSEEIISARPINSFEIGEITVGPEELGSLSIKVTPENYCPYFGIGFGNPISYSKVFSLNMEIGALYHGYPKIDMEANGMITPTASKIQEEIIEDNLKSFNLYLLATIQLSIKLF